RRPPFGKALIPTRRGAPSGRHRIWRRAHAAYYQDTSAARACKFSRPAGDELRRRPTTARRGPETKGRLTIGKPADRATAVGSPGAVAAGATTAERARQQADSRLDIQAAVTTRSAPPSRLGGTSAYVVRQRPVSQNSPEFAVPSLVAVITSSAPLT